MFMSMCVFKLWSVRKETQREGTASHAGLSTWRDCRPRWTAWMLATGRQVPVKLLAMWAEGRDRGGCCSAGPQCSFKWPPLEATRSQDSVLSQFTSFSTWSLPESRSSSGMFPAWTQECLTTRKLQGWGRSSPTVKLCSLVCREQACAHRAASKTRGLFRLEGKKALGQCGIPARARWGPLCSRKPILKPQQLGELETGFSPTWTSQC